MSDKELCEDPGYIRREDAAEILRAFASGIRLGGNLSGAGWVDRAAALIEQEESSG